MAEQEKWTAEQIKEQIEKIKKATEKLKQESKEEHSESITPEQIEKKLKRVKSPMIIFESWGGATPGGTVSCTIGVYNPDPTTATNLYIHVWVGSGNIDPTVGTFLINVDPRFPRLTEPAYSGLSLASGASSSLSFALQVPAAAEKTKYIGNSCLMQFNYLDVGQYLDRGAFVFAVT